MAQMTNEKLKMINGKYARLLASMSQPTSSSVHWPLTQGLLRPSHLPYAGLFCAAVGETVSGLFISGDWQ
jgi:hypothetical protein